jgi:fatty-acyl-CoA synthase
MFGVPDPRLGERAIAAVRVRDGVTLTPDEIKSMVAATLADYKVPSDVVFHPVPLPRTATGKIEKTKLRAQYL